MSTRVYNVAYTFFVKYLEFKEIAKIQVGIELEYIYIVSNSPSTKRYAINEGK